MRRVVRGFWGPRQETAEELAGRWKLLLERIAALLPAAGGGPGAGGEWTWRRIHGSRRPTALRADEESLLAALRADAASPRTSDGAGLRLVSTGEPGWEISVAGRGGGTSEYVLQAVVIAVVSPDGAKVPDAGLLTAVAEVWEPDFGDVTDDDVLDALEDDGGFTVDDPCIGWLGCLSPARAALLPDDVTAGRTELPGGRVLLDIAPRSDAGSVVRTHLRLRDAGVLEPLPRPMDRTFL
ncbi:hypothetical protein OHA79_14070 [Streptomyces sp. NBC_00841]|uniref:hypothetical protein n=1 Tax=unclassified Streptomyces TaxID=2593676 RepID=UPI00224C8C50|nr:MULTISPECIES: hypothetical protein [unclassified Streptomyces]MCX4535871.1 hypothetical protein [Streptomyces sp. NBC_01669]WRZ98855.1 hypothetical protein OHA79_14070 [Streptomyces sp. NBC_00841]